MVVSVFQNIRSRDTVVQVENELESLERKTLAFLAFSDIVDQQGNVFSWLNCYHPGYVYPEIMGYYLTFGCQYLGANPGDSRLHSCLRQRLHRVAQRLQQLVNPLGGVGRDGLIYLFDTAIATIGLLAYQAHFNRPVDQACLNRMARFITHAVEQQTPVFLANGDRCLLAPRWSTVFGSSMIKAVIALNRLTTWTCNPCYQQQGQQLVDIITERYYAGGAFTVFPGQAMVYTHAHCYALEGLLDIQSHGYGDMQQYLAAGANYLKQWQNQDGSLFNWNNVSHPAPMKMGDVTAQAIRIWLAVDRDRYREQIRRGFSFLNQLAASEHGIYYGADSSDINAWATMFTAQALDWYLRGCRPRYVV